MNRVCSTDADIRMPPAAKKPALNTSQIDMLKRWIAEGATYSAHWSFGKLTRPAAPEIRNPKYEIRNPIDAFIRYRLQQEGVAPAKEADRVTLIRRLSFDLTGLPPAPEEVRAFVEDQSPNAYEKLVDRLLASPHYGERMAVWWLDLVRYADSIGYHSDNPMNVWPYRDYVIKAFNTNKPFDQFTIEQLAGDLLPNATWDQRVASAYNRLLQTTEEGGGAGEGVRGEVRLRPRAKLRSGLARRDDHVRGVPQPQVRSVHAGRLLLNGGLLRRHPGAGGRRARTGHADSPKAGRRTATEAECS